MSPDDPRHGETRGYHAHRRDGEEACDPCRDAAATYEQQRLYDALVGRPPRMATSVGTMRRIRGLAAMGYTFRQIGDVAGWGHDFGRKVALYDDSQVIRRSTVDRVSATFKALVMVPPPAETGTDRWRVSYAKTIAAKHGWVVPLAWDDIDTDAAPTATTADRHNPDDYDEAMVLRVINGGTKPRRITRAEAVEVCRRLAARGLDTGQIERLTGLQVARYYRLKDAS